MSRFHTSPTATTWHLKNLRHITNDDREALIVELTGQADRPAAGDTTSG
jgi:hypothetical protein